MPDAPASISQVLGLLVHMTTHCSVFLRFGFEDLIEKFTREF